MSLKQQMYDSLLEEEQTASGYKSQWRSVGRPREMVTRWEEADRDKDVRIAANRYHAWLATTRGKFVINCLKAFHICEHEEDEEGVGFEEDEHLICDHCNLVKEGDSFPCSGNGESYCGDCLEWAYNHRCDDEECPLHWGDDYYRCVTCDSIFNPDELENHGHCLTRGLYCSDCCDEVEPITVCRQEKDCEFCERLYLKTVTLPPEVEALFVKCPDCPRDMLVGEKECGVCWEKEHIIRDIMSAAE